MSTGSPSPSALAGFLALVALLVGGALWGLSRAEPRVVVAKAGDTVLRIAPDEVEASHRHAFTLGRVGRITVHLRNPQARPGRLRIGPPRVAKASAFDPDPAHAREFSIPAEPETTLTWVDLAVGTRVVHIELDEPAPLGVDVTVTPAPARGSAPPTN